MANQTYAERLAQELREAEQKAVVRRPYGEPTPAYNWDQVNNRGHKPDACRSFTF